MSCENAEKFKERKEREAGKWFEMSLSGERERPEG